MENKGKLKEYCEYTATGKLKVKEIYEYDERGKYVYNSKRKLKRSTLYDEKGNKIEECSYNGEAELNWKYTSQYDERGNQIEVCEYEEGVLVSRKTYAYY